jgi:hypothetical protein
MEGEEATKEGSDRMKEKLTRGRERGSEGKELLFRLYEHKHYFFCLLLQLSILLDSVSTAIIS